ncbi:MAG: rhomboid family intramembrane serine protease [Candidatus Electryoneaceae bacterium]|nr:rhomboid family intramembrane serine protease [Candidatus Electryoneaceae bacterium]
MNQRMNVRGGVLRNLSPGVKGLLIANVVIFFLQGVIKPEFLYMLGLTPELFWGHLLLWQPLTYMFLHGGFMHLLFNMLALVWFGNSLETVWGTKQFLRYYFMVGIAAGLFNCILTPGESSLIIGASGAIYGILAAYGLMFPNSVIYLYMLFPIRAKYLVLIFGVIEFIASINQGISQDSGTIAHLVHLGGMLVGIVYLRKDYLLRWGARKFKDWMRKQEHERADQQASTEEKLRQEVDDLLDKINDVGLENLTSRERKRLREASKLLSQMEKDNQ